jgi:hypothetical protein
MDAFGAPMDAIEAWLADHSALPAFAAGASEVIFALAESLVAGHVVPWLVSPAI